MTNRLKAFSPWKRLESVVMAALVSRLPNLFKFAAPIYARIEKVSTDKGLVDETAKRFSADVQPLDNNLVDDPDLNLITDVPFDAFFFGSAGVVYAVPDVGAIARLGFMYGNPAFPFIQSVTNEKQTIPAGSAGEFRIETSKGVILQLKDDKINIKTPKFNTDLERLLDVASEHTHLTGAPGAPTSSPAGSALPLPSTGAPFLPGGETPATFGNGEL